MGHSYKCLRTFVVILLDMYVIITQHNKTWTHDFQDLMKVFRSLCKPGAIVYPVNAVINVSGGGFDFS